MQEIADRINATFRRYGLTHDVVSVDTSGFEDRMRLVGSRDVEQMSLFHTTLEELVACHLAAREASGEHPDQLRLF